MCESIKDKASAVTTNYMLDTCIFNFILDGRFTINDLPSGKYHITHIQRDELNATPDENRRIALEKQLIAVQ